MHDRGQLANNECLFLVWFLDLSQMAALRPTTGGQPNLHEDGPRNSTVSEQGHHPPGSGAAELWALGQTQGRPVSVCNAGTQPLPVFDVGLGLLCVTMAGATQRVCWSLPRVTGDSSLS